jgi:citrate synthase
VPEVSTKNIGLRGVTVADSRISLVDGDAGRLIYRGYSIEDLAANADFAEVVFLLLQGRLPAAAELEQTEAALADARRLPDAVMAMLRTRKPDADPMAVLQGAVAALSDHDPDRGEPDRAARVRSALRLIARTASVVAAWFHVRRGDDPPDPGDAGSHAAGFLRGLWGREPSPAETALLDTMLVIHAEHTLNASTFAVREVASTRADIHASIAAGVGALSGALHGGANARVMEMLRGIGDEDRVEPWVRERIEAGERVMGIGHAVYKTMDPRATVLQQVAADALSGKPEERWYRLALEVERSATTLLKELKGLELYPNVDFYSGGVLHALGLPDDLFPAFFAISRVAGWCAHFIEEEFAEAQPKPALYRPRAHYVGRFCGPQGCQYVPLEQRGAGCPCGKDITGCDEELALAEQ